MKILSLFFLLFAIGTAHAAQEPQGVFKRSCGMCHNGQLPMAPREGDSAAWKPRLEKGMNTLVKHVTEGFNAMPARGMCMDCSADDYTHVIEWMSRQN